MFVGPFSQYHNIIYIFTIIFYKNVKKIFLYHTRYYKPTLDIF